MVVYKEPKLIGKDEDGTYLARIEMIGSGKPLKIFGKTIIKQSKDTIYISNRKRSLWVLSLLNGYRQIGTFEVERPNKYQEGQDIIAKKENDKIVSIETAGE